MKQIVILISLVCAAFLSCNNKAKENNLSKASSPYLREHADNPVDWYEWGDEALQKAKQENKPLLISIGYASCHWCHVMEKESFMDTAVARIMNENFINIKVDREERPDIDNIYMNACQLITGNGGWPLNAFALPDGKPFFAGTYYTTQSWSNLLKEISKAYKEKNNIVISQAEALTKGIAQQELSFLKNEGEPVSLTRVRYTTLFDSVMKDIDTVNGGLKGAPKFPMPALTEFLLQYHYITDDDKAWKAANNTLRRMALGGIYDHVNGGFARYATDTAWRVPHFEKMLYDNGQLLSLYSHAYQVDRSDWYQKLLYEIDGFITTDLTSSEGGFYSSVNADTEKGEGDYYTWTWDEFTKAFSSPDEAKVFAEYFNVTQKGNWPERGRNILYASMDPIRFGMLRGMQTRQSLDMITDAVSKLKKARSKLPKPSVDTKVLTSWNAIMMIGYIDASAATGNEEFLKKALKNAEFLQKNMLGNDGHLWRSYKDGKASIDGFLDDYAWLGKAYTRLYQATFNKQWLMLADKIARYAIDHFYDNNSKMFFYTAANSSDLVVRKMEITDNVIPSSNATMAELLHKLGTYFQNEDYLNKCTRMWYKIAGKVYPLTSYYAQWCYLYGLLSCGTSEVAIMGKDAIEKSKNLQRKYLPDCLFMGETDEENLPLLENKLTNDQTLIYVCTNRVCKLPVEEIIDAQKQISQIKLDRNL